MNEKTKNLVYTALFTAIILLLGLTQLGILSIPPANATIAHIPVIIGTLLLGWKRGLILGFAFGLASVYKLFAAPSALMSPLIGINIIIPIAISILARLMIPIVTHLVSRCFKKKPNLRSGFSAAAGTLANTVFYLGLMLIAYVACGIDYAGLLAIIGGVALLNGACETVLAVIITIPVVLALNAVRKRKTGNR